MDIDLLSKMVKELILDSDRVVLPGLGSFVAEVVPATFTDKGYTINPPYRKLYFRSRPDEGNELAIFYARSNSVSEDVAAKIISDFVTELKSVLFVKKAVIFPGLGRLRATKENNVFFVSDEDLDIYPEGFGLEPISLKTHQETNEQVSAVVADLKNILESPEPVVEPVAALQPEEAPAEIPQPEVSSAVTPVVPTLQVTVKDTAEKKSLAKTMLKAVGWILALLAVLAVAYIIVGRLFPDWIDQFLYTKEELEILNHSL